MNQYYNGDYYPNNQMNQYYNGDYYYNQPINDCVYDYNNYQQVPNDQQYFNQPIQQLQNDQQYFNQESIQRGIQQLDHSEMNYTRIVSCCFHKIIVYDIDLTRQNDIVHIVYWKKRKLDESIKCKSVCTRNTFMTDRNNELFMSYPNYYSHYHSYVHEKDTNTYYLVLPIINDVNISEMKREQCIVDIFGSNVNISSICGYGNQCKSNNGLDFGENHEYEHDSNKGIQQHGPIQGEMPQQVFPQQEKQKRRPKANFAFIKLMNKIDDIYEYNSKIKTSRNFYNSKNNNVYFPVSNNFVECLEEFNLSKCDAGNILTSNDYVVSYFRGSEHIFCVTIYDAKKYITIDRIKERISENNSVIAKFVTRSGTVPTRLVGDRILFTNFSEKNLFVYDIKQKLQIEIEYCKEAFELIGAKADISPRGFVLVPAKIKKEKQQQQRYYNDFENDLHIIDNETTYGTRFTHIFIFDNQGKILNVINNKQTNIAIKIYDTQKFCFDKNNKIYITGWINDGEPIKRFMYCKINSVQQLNTKKKSSAKNISFTVVHLVPNNQTNQINEINQTNEREPTYEIIKCKVTYNGIDNPVKISIFGSYVIVNSNVIYKLSDVPYNLMNGNVNYVLKEIGNLSFNRDVPKIQNQTIQNNPAQIIMNRNFI